MEKLLTPTVEKDITRDWQIEMPSLSVYRPRHLLRRMGPLLVGVCLDRDSSGDKYKPCFHVHCLARDFPAVSLTLCTQLRSTSGGLDYIEVSAHDRRYREAASRLRDQALLPLAGPISISQVLEAYVLHLQTPLGQRQAAILHADSILLLLWCGKTVEAAHRLDQTLLALQDDKPFQNLGGRQLYEQKMCSAIENPDQVRQTVRSEIEKHRVNEIQSSEFLC